MTVSKDQPLLLTMTNPLNQQYPSEDKTRIYRGWA